MVVESIVILSTYWPQSLSVSDPTHTQNNTSWTITSNNAVNVGFTGGVTNIKFSGYGSISGDTIMPADNGTFRVSVDLNDDASIFVTPDEK